VLTGKGINWCGSLIRPEATGYGSVYFCQEMLSSLGQSIKDKTALVSGSGNVAQYTIEKLIELGARVVTCSDSNGYIFDEEGINREKLDFVMDLKNVRRRRISDYAEKYKSARYTPVDPKAKFNPLWEHQAQLAFPSATQNEVNLQDAMNLIKNGVIAVSEGANMPTTPDAVKCLQENRVLFAPGKAANAGGVSVSGLEMAQNSMRYSWTREEVDKRLHLIMKTIHNSCVEACKTYGMGENYVAGANIAGFVKVADAMLDQGVF